MGLFAAASAAIGFASGRDRLALTASGISVFGVIATVGVSMFPFILPSSLDPRSSLTVWDASSSKATLLTMLAATVIFLPLILIYTTFIYRVLRGRVSGRTSKPITAAIEAGEAQPCGISAGSWDWALPAASPS